MWKGRYGDLLSVRGFVEIGKVGFVFERIAV